MTQVKDNRLALGWTGWGQIPGLLWRRCWPFRFCKREFAAQLLKEFSCTTNWCCSKLLVLFIRTFESPVL